MKTLWWFALAWLISFPATAGAPGTINFYNAICDPNFPTRCAAPDASGNLPVTGSFTSTTSAVATAVAPTYSEGATEPLSMDLNGGIRVTGSFSATTTATATAADPSYVEGSTAALSQDLSGHLRTIIGNGAGAAAVNIQDGGNSITVDGTFWQATQPVSAASLPLPSGASTSAKQDTIITDLGAINTTLGSPFQVGGSIGNTTFGATQDGAWTVTANAGTNLNTSALALESGGNLASAATSLSTLAGTVTTGAIKVFNGGTFAVQPNGAMGVLGITPTDRTIASASGSSETLMASNASRHSMLIENTGNADCGVNPTGGTAAIGGAGTLTLYPGGAYMPSVPTLSAVTVICTAGQPVYAEEN